MNSEIYLQRSVLNEGFDCLVVGKTEFGVEFGGSVIAVLGALPEESFIVAHERCGLHLRLMFEDSVSFGAQFLGRHRHSHLNEINTPLHPSAAVHPYPAVFEPGVPGFGLFEIIDSRKHGVGADAVCAVRVSKITGYEDLVRFDLQEQVFDDTDIAFGERAFLDCAGLIERQVEEVDMIQRQSHVSAGSCCLATADERLDVEDLAGVLITDLLLAKEVQVLVVLLVDNLVVGQMHEFVALNEVHEADHLVVTDGDTAGSLVGNVNIMPLIDESCERTAHTDDIVIGVRGEDHHVLREGFSPFGTIAVVGVGFASRPTGDGMLQVIEDLDVAVIGRAEERYEF